MPKKVDVTGERRRLHYEEQLYDMYSSPNIIRVIKSRRMRCIGLVVRIRDWRGAYRISVGRHEEKIPLGRPRRRWEDNIKMDMAGYRERDNDISGSIKFGEFLD